MDLHFYIQNGTSPDEAFLHWQYKPYRERTSDNDKTRDNAISVCLKELARLQPDTPCENLSHAFLPSSSASIPFAKMIHPVPLPSNADPVSHIFDIYVDDAIMRVAWLSDDPRFVTVLEELDKDDDIHKPVLVSEEEVHLLDQALNQMQDSPQGLELVRISVARVTLYRGPLIKTFPFRYHTTKKGCRIDDAMNRVTMRPRHVGLYKCSFEY
jgi:hypothetical protein